MAPPMTAANPNGDEEQRMFRISHSGLVARSPEGHAAKGMQIKGNEDLWVEIQAHTFRNWVNEQLKPKGLSVRDLESDLCDGLKLIALLEVLQKKQIRKIPRPINQHQFLENVQFALNSIENDGIKLVNIGNEDIVNGNLKLILGLIWSLILRYQIGRSKFPPKKLMLAWLQAVLPECRPGNFTTDWNSGVSLSALLDYCKPGLFPHWRDLDPADGVRNCKNAMEIAQREFGIPMVLEPEYLASPYLDELSGMTYLSYFMKENSPGYKATLRWAKQTLPNLNVNNFTTDWNDGLAACSLVRSFGGPVSDFDRLQRSESHWEANLDKAFQGGRRIGVEPLLKPKEMADSNVNHLGPMAYVARFHWLTAKNVPGERIQVSSDVKVVKINIPVKFKVEFLDEDVDPRQVRAEIHGPNNYRSEVRLEVEASTTTPRKGHAAPRVAHGVFVPQDIGMHQIVVTNEGEVGKGCPLPVRATPETVKYTLGGIDPCAIGSIVEVLVSPNGAAGNGVEVAAIAPSGLEKSCPVTHDEEGVYLATFQPDEAGEWKIAVTYEGEHIEGSPFTCYVYDPNAIRVTDLDGACPCLDFTFTVDSRDCGYGETIVDIVHQGRSIPYRVIPFEEGLSKITFRPPERGKFRIYVYFNGIEPKASPFTLRVGSHDHDSKKIHELEKRTRKLLAGWDGGSGSGGGSKRSSVEREGTPTTGSLPRMTSSGALKPSATRTSSGGGREGIADYAAIRSPTLVMDGTSTTPRKHSTLPRTDRRSSSASSTSNLLNVTSDSAGNNNNPQDAAARSLMKDHGGMFEEQQHQLSSSSASKLFSSNYSSGSLGRKQDYGSNLLTSANNDGRYEEPGARPAGTSSPLLFTSSYENSSQMQKQDRSSNAVTSSSAVESNRYTSLTSSLLKSGRAFRSSLGSLSNDSPSGSRRGSRDAPGMEAEAEAVVSNIRHQQQRGSLTGSLTDSKTMMATTSTTGATSSSFAHHKQQSRLVTSSTSEDQTDVGLHRTLGHHTPLWGRAVGKSHAQRGGADENTSIGKAQDDYEGQTTRTDDVILDDLSEAKLVPVNKQCGFVVSAEDARPSDVHVRITAVGSDDDGGDQDGVVGGASGGGIFARRGSGTRIPYRVTDNRDGTFVVQYTPRAVGELVVQLKVKGTEVKGSPFHVIAYDASKIKVGRIPSGTVGEPVEFEIDGSEAGAGNLEILVNGGHVTSEVRSLGEPQRFVASFIPHQPIPHTIDMKFNDHPVPGSPWHIDVTAHPGLSTSPAMSSPLAQTHQQQEFQYHQQQQVDSRRASIVDGDSIRTVSAGQTISFDISAPGCYRGDLEIYVAGPSKQPVPFRLFEAARDRSPSPSTSASSAGNFRLEFTGAEVGTYTADVAAYDGTGSAGAGRMLVKAVGSPFVAKVYDASLIRVSDMPAEPVGVGSECRFRVDASQAGEGQLEISVCDGEVPNHVDVLGGGHCLVSFVPEKAVEHNIEIKFNGDPVPGCPFYCQVTDGGRVRVDLGHLELIPADEPAVFVIHVDGSTPAELGVSVRAPSSATLPVRVNGSTRTGFRAEFLPKEIGAHSVVVEYNGAAVPGTPFVAKVYDSKRVYVSPLPKGIIGKALQFTVDAGQAGEGNLEITISANGRNIPTQVHPQGNARFAVSFVPLEAIDHVVIITFNKEDVSGSPFVVHVSAADSSSNKSRNRSPISGHAGLNSTGGKKPAYFTISNVTGTVEDLELNVTGGQAPYKLRR